ncbi:MAG TPA: TonB-dependent receptor [Verrucomicrobiales bacterium]|jgi:hemoglobin/transferrin/lactoferrin receptor protein|nr:TonB-dependent receptor [Verrucomicrobiales bacterium]
MKIPLALLLAAFPALAAPPPVLDPVTAKPDSNAATLPPVIITATRQPESVFDVPYSAVVLGRDWLEDRGARSLPDSLKELPGVMIQKTAAGQGSPYIRGYTGFRNLAMIDGIRLNNSTFREGPNQYWNTIDPYGLDAIELTRGQGSVLYGSDAIGGTLNARTKSPLYFPAVPQGKSPGVAGWHTGGQLFSRYASGENAWIGHAEGFLSQDKVFGLFLGGSVKDFGNIDAADLGTLPKTGYDEWDIDAKAEFWLDDTLKLTLAHQQVHQNDVWRTHRTIYGVPWEGAVIGTDKRHVFDQDRTLTYARLDGTPGGAIDSWQFTLSYHNQEELRHRIRSNNLIDFEGVDVDTLGATLQFMSETGAGKFTYGLDYYHDSIDSYHDDYNAAGVYTGSAIQGPVGDNSTYHLFGAFVQDVISLGDRTELTLGARYTWAKADLEEVADPVVRGNTISIEDDWNNVVGSLRLSHDLDTERHYKLYAGVAQGFRAPNASDLSRLDIARSGELETAAPGLDPEHFLNYEIGFKAQRDTVRGGISVFYSDITDMIVRAPTGNIVNNLTEVTKRNAGDGYIWGLELEGEWDFTANWTLFGGFGWQEGEVDGFPTSSPNPVEEPVSRLLPATGTAGVRFTPDSKKWWVEGSVTAADKADRLSSGDIADNQRIPPGGTPGYVIFNLRAGWHVNENLTLTAAVENLTDEDYRIHGSGQNEPGINAIVTANLKF